MESKEDICTYYYVPQNNSLWADYINVNYVKSKQV